MKNYDAKKLLLTPMMLATVLATVSSTSIAYDHKGQTSILSGQESRSPYQTLQDTTYTQTVNPTNGMIYSDAD